MRRRSARRGSPEQVSMTPLSTGAGCESQLRDSHDRPKTAARRGMSRGGTTDAGPGLGEISHLVQVRDGLHIRADMRPAVGGRRLGRRCRSPRPGRGGRRFFVRSGERLRAGAPVPRTALSRTSGRVGRSPAGGVQERQVRAGALLGASPCGLAPDAGLRFDDRRAVLTRRK